MSYYPYIPYLEASQSIVKNLSDIPRIDMEMEDRKQRQGLINAQLANYEAGQRRFQREEEQYQQDKQLGQDVSLAMASVDVASGNKSLASVIAPKLLSAGKWKEAMAVMEEQRKAEKDRFDGRNKILETAYKFRKTPTLMKNYMEDASRFYPELKNYDFTSLSGDKTKIDTIEIINPVTGKVDGYYAVDDEGKIIHEKPIPITISGLEGVKNRADAIRKMDIAKKNGDMETYKELANYIQSEDDHDVEIATRKAENEAKIRRKYDKEEVFDKKESRAKAQLRRDGVVNPTEEQVAEKVNQMYGSTDKLSKAIEKLNMVLNGEKEPTPPKKETSGKQPATEVKKPGGYVWDAKNKKLVPVK